MTTSGNAGASFRGREHAGTSRLVIDERRRVIVGATFVGTEIAEMLHAATVAVVGEVPLETLWHAVPAFPTRNEVWLKLLEELRALIAAAPAQMLRCFFSSSRKARGKPGDVVEVVEAVEAADLLAVGEDAPGLGHREAERPQLLVARPR